MTILQGQLDNLYNSSKKGALLEEYTIYKKENGRIIKRTASRKYTSTSYIDAVSSTPMGNSGYAVDDS
tara:strand:- start:172 stop:375 length:204 start_codon:yes stop_codon:yes gene_type:complete